jgi:UDP-N-acetyl-D-mannosaminuronic acid dehydrogenase
MGEMSRVAVVGLGYIGLPTAACLAAAGMEVVGVDLDRSVVDRVNRGDAHFAEPGLAAAVSRAVAMARLSAQTDMPQADAYIIAVPTPFDAGHRPDLGHVTAAADRVAGALRGGEIIVLESTCPPGTTRRVGELIAARRPGLRVPGTSVPGTSDSCPDVHIAHCPERVLPGRIMTEITANDRVIGGLTPECAERVSALYRTFCHGKLIRTGAESAEMAKLAENAYRDVNIAFANELSLICGRLGLDPWEVRRLANHHPRVGILRPGPGVGGHCIAVDPWFIIDAAPDLAPLMRTARAVNDQRPAGVAEQIVAATQRLRAPQIACLGLSFKADVEDMRNSPAAEIVHRVAVALPDTKILAVEPNAPALPPFLDGLPNVVLTDAGHAIREAGVIGLLVDHARFRQITRTDLSGKVVCDTRGMWA